MNDHNYHSDVTTSVMDQIKAGKVQMKPRLYYTLLGLVSAAAVLLTGLTMSYLWSIVFLWIRIETATTPARGARANLAEALGAFPWWALIASVLLLAVAVVLVRRHGQMYRHRITTITLIVLFCSLLVGMGLSALDVGRDHTPNRFEGRDSGRGAHMLK